MSLTRFYLQFARHMDVKVSDLGKFDSENIVYMNHKDVNTLQSLNRLTSQPEYVAIRSKTGITYASLEESDSVEENSIKMSSLTRRNAKTNLERQVCVYDIPMGKLNHVLLERISPGLGHSGDNMRPRLEKRVVAEGDVVLFPNLVMPGVFESYKVVSCWPDDGGIIANSTHVEAINSGLHGYAERLFDELFKSGRSFNEPRYDFAKDLTEFIKSRLETD